MKAGSRHSEASRKQMSVARSRRPGLPPMSDEELTLFRDQPNREKLRRIRDYAVCRECGARVAYIDAHLRQHGITTKQYRGKWPGAALASAEVLKANRELMARKRKGNPTKFRKQRRAHYEKHRDRLLPQRRAKEGSIPREDYLQLVKRESRVLAFPSRPADRGANSGRPKEIRENRRFFKVGKLIEEKITSGMELTAARRAVAKTMGISYNSAVRYHKQFRGLDRGDGNQQPISITG